MMRIHPLLIIALVVLGFLTGQTGARAQEEMPPKYQLIIDNTKPLKFPRGERLPLYVFSAHDIIGKDDAQTERMVKELDKRGIGVVMSWSPANKEKSLDAALRVAAIQKKLGLMVNVDASGCMDGFFNGDPLTAHVDANGKPFFDESFGKDSKMGCPFALDFRYGEIKSRMEYFVNAYKARKITVGFIWVDWEVDGPIEWNGAWEASKKCTRCREHLNHVQDFHEFQTKLRAIRCDIQKKCYADVLKSAFPDVLVGNYAVYPNDGFRYWYDYFEQNAVDGMPYKTDQRARYREWANEFPQTGYTFAMPVVYTWYSTFGWYDFESDDYRWFYNMLLNATNACKNTPKNVPVISFVHWHTTAPPDNPDPNVKQFSEAKYQELLWHMLLRGTSDLYMWSDSAEYAKETQLVQEVYADSLQYKEFLDKGKPISFNVPTWQGPVISGLKYGEKILVRRTDFDDTMGPVNIQVDGQTVAVPRAEGKCQVIALKEQSKYMPYLDPNR